MRVIALALIVLSFIVPSLFNSCEPVHEEDILSSTGACENIKIAAFTTGKNGLPSFHQFAQEKCASCHTQGGPPSFANPDTSISYPIFNGLNASAQGWKVYSQATTKHDSYSGDPAPYTAADLTDMNNEWALAEGEYKACLDKANNNNNNNNDDDTVTVSIYTSDKTMNANGNEKTISWDLSSEMADPANAIQGASLSVVVFTTTDDATGDTYYNIKDVEMTGGVNPAHARTLKISINGNLVPLPAGGTFKTIDRLIPAGGTRRLCGSNNCSPMTYSLAVSASDTIALAFNELTDQGISFNPPTFTQLLAGGGALSSCTNCHNAGAQLFDFNNYALVVSTGKAVPFNPDASVLYQRMNETNPALVMPRAGMLPQAQRDQVRDWILDGTPQ